MVDFVGVSGRGGEREDQLLKVAMLLCRKVATEPHGTRTQDEQLAASKTLPSRVQQSP